MPIYEYRCTACSHELEALQKFSDPVLVTCPACGAETLLKKISAAGFHLKGSGWYATDFKGSGSKPAVKEKSDSASADSKSEKSESKSDTSEAKSDKAESKSDKAAPKTESKADAAPAGGGSSAPASCS
ncbi:MAG: zinc ribbon domain-containing protein [Pseudomonadota bacterium]|nr:zinc ribbon domain-containing protein [Pseudomonadota bacterium]